jgi:hypothetical protein
MAEPLMVLKTKSKEFDNFTKLTDALLSVPHDQIQKQIEQHRKQAAKNPHKPGPRPKK